MEKGTKNITIDGLEISATTTPLIVGNFGAGNFDGAVSGDSLDSCSFVNMTVRNVGGWAFKFKGNNIHVENCEIGPTGAGGLNFGGDNVKISNNHIHDVGFIYPSAIALLGSGSNNLISHNELHNTTYSAICYGGKNSIIENNLFYDTMKVLNDGAAIYFGWSKGVVVRGNVVRGSRGSGPAHAYYMDEKADSCVVEKNLAVDTLWPSHNHMTLNCIIRNNIFIDKGSQKLTFPRSFGMRLEKNILIAEEITISTPTGEKTPEKNKEGVPKAVWPFFDATGITSMPNNIIFSSSGKVTLEKLIDYRDVKKEPLKPHDGSVFADPMFIDIEKGNYGFKPDSPAVKLGIEPVDFSKAGRLK